MSFGAFRLVSSAYPIGPREEQVADVAQKVVEAVPCTGTERGTRTNQPEFTSMKNGQMQLKAKVLYLRSGSAP
jgi:hypothetical protein